jgi:hypothetical protein
LDEGAVGGDDGEGVVRSGHVLGGIMAAVGGGR